MSYVEMSFFGKDGTVKCSVEFRNAHCGAMAVWRYLDEKYLPPFEKYGIPMSRMLDENEVQKWWDLQHDERLTESERICLLSTFDKVIIFRANFERLAKAFREFGAENTHLPAEADALDEALKDSEIIALGFCQTSVCQNEWTRNRNRSEEDDAEYEFYNILTGEDHWNLFEHSALKKAV